LSGKKDRDREREREREREKKKALQTPPKKKRAM
jgi:hypothetical protein